MYIYIYIDDDWYGEFYNIGLISSAAINEI